MMDPMEGVQRMYDHSDNLGLNGFPKFYDECNTAAPDFQFFKVLEDCGTIHPSTNEEHAYITYKFDGFNYFEIKVSGVETITDRFKERGRIVVYRTRNVCLAFCPFDHNTENRTR